jgi:hypothetical protein
MEVCISQTARQMPGISSPLSASEIRRQVQGNCGGEFAEVSNKELDEVFIADTVAKKFALTNLPDLCYSPRGNATTGHVPTVTR